MLIGCGGSDEASKPTTDAAPRSVTNVALRIAVVNDAELVAAISKLRGEWQEHGGSQLTVSDISLDGQLSESDIDLLIFPSRYLGELCEAGRLRPMRHSILESKEVDFGDILPLVREREIVYGQRVMALPLGCPAPLVATTGMDSGEIVSPLAGQSAALVLMARAAPLAFHPNREAIWFDPETMQPRLTEPPFVRALTELVESISPVESPCEVAGRLLGGEIPSAIVWPCRTANVGAATTFSARPLPAVAKVYNPVAKEWRTSPPRQVTLLATSGRLVGVTTKSRNAASAFRLAGWLASSEVARQFVTSSDGLAIFRESQRRMADNWLGKARAGDARQFSEQLAAALRQREGVTVPRLPGVDRYLNELAEAVRAAAEGRATPSEALAKAAQDWERLTTELGRDRQRLAYRRCLGIEQ